MAIRFFKMVAVRHFQLKNGILTIDMVETAKVRQIS